MKEIAAILALLMLLAVVPSALAVENGEQIRGIDTHEIGVQELNNELNKIQSPNSDGASISSFNKRAVHTTSASASGMQFYPAVIAYSRIGNIRDDIAEYRIDLKVGSGNYDIVKITSFVKEKYPYRITTTKAMDMSLGQSLTPILYREKAIEMAETCDCAVYIFGRREDNIKLDLGLNDSEINAIMEKWSNDKFLMDMYYGVVISKIQTGFLARENPKNIKVAAWGHSLGAKNWDDYDKMDYDKKLFGGIILDMPVDMIMGYDPIYRDLIAIQMASFNETRLAMNNGKFYSDEGATIIYVTAMAANPETANNKSELPYLTDYTNLEVFRKMNFETWQFGSPFTPNFHYLDGDINKLYDVNEQEMMEKILNGGVAPYTPLFEDLVVSGQLGGIPEFQTDASKTDANIISINFKGGMDYFGEYSARQTAEIKNSLMVIAMWYNLPGHASIIFAENPKIDKFWRDTSIIIKET